MSSVLLITRDASTEKLAESALVPAGHKVIAVPSADAAIRSLFNVSASLIILDSSVGKEEARQVSDWLQVGQQVCPLVLLTGASARWLDDAIPFSESATKCSQSPARPAISCAPWRTPCAPASRREKKT